MTFIFVLSILLFISDLDNYFFVTFGRFMRLCNIQVEDFFLHLFLTVLKDVSFRNKKIHWKYRDNRVLINFKFYSKSKFRMTECKIHFNYFLN